MTDDDFVSTRLVMIRHGESNTTVERKIGGPRTCSGLSELGRQQADRLARRLAETHELPATVLISSGYPRAIETAQALAPVLELDVTVDPRFGEHDPGPECDGLKFADFIERYGRPDWETDPHATVFPGGETIAEFHHRVGAALTSVVQDHVGGAIVVACHGGVVDAAFRRLLSLPITGNFDLFTTNTSITEFVHSRRGRWRLTRYNDSAHLAGLPVATLPAE